MSRARNGQAEEIHRLQGCLNNLISVLALPALWGGGDSARIVATLLEGLLGMLRLDFAYARLNDTIDGAPSEIIRLQKRKTEADAQEVGRMLVHWLPLDTSISPQVVAIPSEGGTVSVAALRLGLADEMGVLVAGSVRADFPTQMELLLLQVGVNQAVIGLQEARRLSGQKETAKELEQRIAERTAQLRAANEELTAANEEVRREIAEREHTEEEWFKLASLVENSSDFIGLAALDGSVLYVNRAGQEMVGMVGDERLRGSRILDYVGEDEAERVQKQILPAVTRDGRWEGETTFRNSRTGHSIPMHQHVFLIMDPLRDRPVALATISRNITERKQEERELMDLKDELAVELRAMTRLHELSTGVLTSTELQPLLEEVLDATIALQSADFGLVQRYNPAIDALDVVAHRGFQRDFIESSGVGDGETFYERTLERGARVLIEDVQTDPGFEPYRDSAASAGFRAVQSTPLFSRSGEPLGVISTHFRRPHRASDRDLRLTDLYAGQAVVLIELKGAEEKLRKVNERIESILQSTTDSCIDLSRDWRFTYLNQHAAEQMKILGKDPAALIGKVLWEEFPHVPNEAALRRVMCERLPVTEELYVASLGEWIENHMYPSVDGGLVAFQKIITERKRAEEALHMAHTELAHVTRVTMMGELAASIAHEVNQPLAAVIANGHACVRWLAAEPTDMQEANAALTRIIREANRASDVISRIRTLLRREDLHSTELDMAEVIGDVVELVQGEVARRGVLLRFTSAAGLPRISGDRVQLQQVLMNLVMNAMEAMTTVDEGLRVLHVRVNESPPDGLLVSVQDAGIGLDPERREHVFDAFYSTKPAGMGMGLAISRSIVEGHGGRLWATANDVAGETFHFILPLAATAAP